VEGGCLMHWNGRRGPECGSTDICILFLTIGSPSDVLNVTVRPSGSYVMN
jgi:hypothetical protein